MALVADTATAVSNRVSRARGTIDAFDFDPGSGDLDERRTIVRKPGVAPDGLTVDDRGDIWVAL
jgi:sugar lactone lactonase YvrE